MQKPYAKNIQMLNDNASALHNLFFWGLQYNVIIEILIFLLDLVTSIPSLFPKDESEAKGGVVFTYHKDDPAVIYSK